MYDISVCIKFKPHVIIQTLYGYKNQVKKFKKMEFNNCKKLLLQELYIPTDPMASMASSFTVRDCSVFMVRKVIKQLIRVGK